VLHLQEFLSDHEDQSVLYDGSVLIVIGEPGELLLNEGLEDLTTKWATCAFNCKDLIDHLQESDADWSWDTLEEEDRSLEPHLNDLEHVFVDSAIQESLGLVLFVGEEEIWVALIAQLLYAEE